MNSLEKSKTLLIARLQVLAAFVSAVFMALPEAAHLAWLGAYLPGPMAVLLFLGFALALAWRRLSDDLMRNDLQAQTTTEEAA